jgi:glycosyltransferase involved in cell wall biosynthesis
VLIDFRRFDGKYRPKCVDSGDSKTRDDNSALFSKHIMKILHFTDSLRSGGKERQLIELLKGLSSHEHIRCEVATMSNDVHYKELFDLGIKIHFLLRKSKKDLGIIPALYSLCKKNQPDIIQTWGSFPSLFAAVVSKITGIKFVNGTIRKAPIRLSPFREDWIRSKFTFPFSDKIVANSLAGLKSYKAPKRKGLCIYNGFDFDRTKKVHDPESIRRLYGVADEKVVGMVATFSSLKDYETYFIAASLILAKRSDVVFIAVGDGPHFEKHKRCIPPRFQERIKLLGKQENVESIINIFDIGVLATYTEGLSNSIMEYMALSKPVVASENDGNKELVDDNRTGFLVKQRDPGDMSRAISRLLDDKELRIVMGSASLKRIEDQFSLQKMTRSYVNLYEDLLPH